MMDQRPKRRAGRPPRSHGPKLPVDEVDRLLVEGELAPGPCGVPVRRWPSQREIARRYDVTSSLMCQFANRYRCAERREQYQAGHFAARTGVDGSPQGSEASGSSDGPDSAGEGPPAQQDAATGLQPADSESVGALDGPSEPAPSASASLQASHQAMAEPSPEDGDPFVDPPVTHVFGDLDDNAGPLDTPQSERRPVTHALWAEPTPSSGPRPAPPAFSPPSTPSPPSPLAPVIPIRNGTPSQSQSPAPQWPARGPGRPLKSDPERIAYEELDRLLVLGELQTQPDGSTKTVYPSYQQLADRYGVAASVICDYAKSHNCQRRRKDAQTRIAMRIEERIIQERAETLALDRSDVVKMIDRFLMGFNRALAEGRVRSDNPTDINTMVRLKEFILGGADSRQELQASFSLQGIQQRYARAMREDREISPALAGAVLPSRTEPSATQPVIPIEHTLNSIAQSSTSHIDVAQINNADSPLASEPADAGEEEPVEGDSNADEDGQ